MELPESLWTVMPLDKIHRFKLEVIFSFVVLEFKAKTT